MVTLVAALSCMAAGSAAAAPLPPQIHTVAKGIGQAAAVAELPGGGFLYVDSVNDLVREVSPSGTVSTVAGNGTTTDVDGVPAVQSGLNGPVAVAALPGGGFLITEYNGSVVRMVSPDGTIGRVAGTGAPSQNSTTSGPATSVGLNYPTDAEPTSDGSILIADTFNNVIRDDSPSGTMTTIAGGGPCNDATGACGGMPAGAVGLNHPYSVSPIQGGSGGYLIGEYDNDTVQKVSPGGILTTVAGSPGQAGYGGDGGPATAALLDHPGQVVSTSDGGFLIADTNNERVRDVSAAGVITTVAGNGTASYAGDGGDATAASLDGPDGISPTPDGGFLIADAYNGAVRAVTMPPTTTITIVAPTGNNGWFDTPAHVTITTTNGTKIRCESDPVQPPPAFNAMPAGCPFKGKGGDVTGDGTHTVYAASVDAAGDKEVPISASFRIDMTPPTLVCTGAAPTFTLGKRNAKVKAAVSDQLSGPASPTASVVADTSTVGAWGATVFGADRAGNIGDVGCAYNVVPETLRPAPRLEWSFSAGLGSTSILRLVVLRVPAHAQVGVTCSGVGCPFSVKRGVTPQQLGRKAAAAGRTRTIDLTPLFGRASLAPGATFTVSVTKTNTLGRVWRFTVRRRLKPVVRTGCLQPGSLTAAAGCAVR